METEGGDDHGRRGTWAARNIHKGSLDLQFARVLILKIRVLDLEHVSV